MDYEEGGQTTTLCGRGFKTQTNTYDVIFSIVKLFVGFTTTSGNDKNQFQS